MIASETGSRALDLVAGSRRWLLATAISGARLGVRLAIATVLCWSAVGKLRRPFDFLEAVYGYELLGPRASLWVAAGLPYVELSLGLALLFGVAARGATLGAAMLGAVFVVAQTHAIVTGLDIPCGCFGNDATSDEKVGVLTLIRAACFLAGSILLLISRNDRNLR